MRPIHKLFKLLNICLMSLGIGIILSTIIIKIHSCVFLEITEDKKNWQDLIIHVVICVISVVYLYLYEKKSINTFTKRPPNFFRLGPGIVVAQLIMIFSMTLWTSIQQEWWKLDTQLTLHFDSTAHFLFFGILQVTCLAAIGEELLFRGVFQPLLYTITQRRVQSILISALLFSLIHGDRANMSFYFIMGCFFSYLYHKTGHIIYPIIAHAMHNLCMVSIIYFQIEEKLDWFMPRFTILSRMILVIGCWVIIYFYISHITKQKHKAKRLN